jgi:hypothetical protein
MHQIQCEHEYCANGCVFELEKYSSRHLQDHHFGTLLAESVRHTDQLFEEESSPVVCVAADEEAKGENDGSVGDDGFDEDMTLSELAFEGNTMDGNSTAFATSETTHIAAIQDHALSATSENDVSENNVVRLLA